MDRCQPSESGPQPNFGTVTFSKWFAFATVIRNEETFRDVLTSKKAPTYQILKAAMKRPFNYRQTRNSKRKSATARCIDYGQLEDRRVLTTMIYVDFGFGVDGELVVSDAQSAAANGPEIFGESTSLISFRDSIEQLNRDLNLDGARDGYDAVDMAAQVLKNLQQIFAPFNAQVRWVHSPDVAGMQSVLNAHEGNDAYIYIGGASPLENLDFGAATVDIGNTSDNLGFVFAHDILEPRFRGIALQSPQNLSIVYSPAYDISWQLARNIAKQAGHTFGLESTEAGDRAAANDVMTMRGTAAGGGANHDLSFQEVDSFFANNDLPLAQIDGVSAGTQNGYELMSENVGVRGISPYFFSGTGDFDEIVVSRHFFHEGDSIVSGLSIEMAGNVTVLSPSDVANGLIIDGGMYGGIIMDNVTIDGALSNTNITVRNVRSIAAVDNSFAGLDNDWSIHRRGQEVIGKNVYSNDGTLNDNVRFQNIQTMFGGSGVDVFRFETPEFARPSGSNDTLSSNFFILPSLESSSAFGNGGDDIFIMSSGAETLDGGAGNDRFVFLENVPVYNIVGAGGFDIIDYSESSIPIQARLRGVGIDGQFEFGIRQNAIVGAVVGSVTPPAQSGIERFVADQEIDGYISSLSADNDDADDLRLIWIIDGDKTILTDRTSGARTEFIGNLISFAGSDQHNDLFFVKSTTTDFEIFNADFVQVSSDFDLSNGRLDSIQHKITLRSSVDGAPANPVLVIGNRAGGGLKGLIMHDRIGGLTNQAIVLDNYAPAIVAHGSETEADFIAVSSTAASVRLMGYGGDDIFTVGFKDPRSGATYVQPTLNTITGRVRLDGGAGLDRVRVDHRQGTGMNFEVRQELLSATDTNGGETSFAGISYKGFESLRLSNGAYLNNNLSSVNVWANESTHYEIVTRTHRLIGTPKTPTNELVGIKGPVFGRQFVPDPNSTPQSRTNGTAAGTWQFNNERRSVKITRIDTTFGEPGSFVNQDQFFAGELEDLI